MGAGNRQRRNDDGLQIHIRDFQRTFAVDRARVRALAARTLLEMKPRCRSVSIVFVGTGKMRELNRIYRGRDEVTDVLSFPLAEEPVGREEEEELGDVVICPSRADRQAREAGKRLEDELDLLVVHGLLHLCGIHHGDEKERRRMARLERKILGGTA